MIWYMVCLPIFSRVFLTPLKLNFIGMTCIQDLLIHWVVTMIWQHVLDIPMKHVIYWYHYLFLLIIVTFCCFFIIGMILEGQISYHQYAILLYMWSIQAFIKSYAMLIVKYSYTRQKNIYNIETWKHCCPLMNKIEVCPLYRWFQQRSEIYSIIPIPICRQ